MMNRNKSYKRGFFPYAAAAFLIGIVGGFSTVLGPAFVRDIGIDYNNTTWTALTQAMSTAACAPVLGKIGDVIGRKITLILGIAVFTLGNIMSALSGSLIFMLTARFVVGLGTAAMSPVIIAYIVTEFPPDEVSKGFSLYMLISSASVIAGPALGGVIISSYGWRAMLWVCTAICIAVLAVCAVTGERAALNRGRLTDFDMAGAAAVLVFFSLMLCIPVFGQNYGWSSIAFISVLAASAISLAALFWAERRTENPILPGSFMKRKSFILSIIALFLTQGLMQANMTDIIVFVNYTQPENTVVSGYAISVMYLGMSFGACLPGILSSKIEPKYLLAASLTVTGLGCGAMLLFSENTPLILLMASLGILGLGLGGNGTVFMEVALFGLSPDEAGAGTGTYGLFRDLAAPFGVAVLVPLFTNEITSLAANGASAAASAVTAVKSLAVIEILSVAAGIAVVLMLPKIKNKGEKA